MKFNEFIDEIEKSKATALSDHELIAIKKIWNACVDCISDEWPVLGDPIRKLKQVYNNNPMQPTTKRIG